MELEIDKIKLDDDSEQTGWFDMPYEMREIVINHMKLQAKGIFAQISQQCLEEVQLSNNLNAFCLEIKDIGSERSIEYICVSITTDDEEDDFLEFFTVCNTSVAPENEQALADFRNGFDDGLFEVDSREKMREFILQNFRGLWMILKSSLRQLMIEMDDFPYDQMKLGNLNGLNTINLSANTKNNQIDPIRSGFIDIEQLRLVEIKISIPSLTIDQIFQLKAVSIDVGYDGGELYDLDQIIDRIINGELDENVNSITIRPKHCVDKISGIFARRMQFFAKQILVKRVDKMVKITDHRFGVVIDTKVLTDIDQTDNSAGGFFVSAWRIL